MIFTETTIPGVFVIELERRNDDRGFFARQWCADEFSRAGLDTRIAQVNMARSLAAGTLRGLHYQKAPHAEVKLVRCTRGAVFDVAIDLRVGRLREGGMCRPSLFDPGGLVDRRA